MTNQLARALLPLNKYGDLDQRFEESIKRIILDIGSEATQVLSDFYIKTSELQRSASKAGLELVEAIYREADRLETSRYKHEGEDYVWMHKTLRKNVAEILSRIGFKNKNVSKIIKAVEFKESLTIQSHWINQLSVSHLNELGRMNETGIKQAIANCCTDETTLIGIQFGGIPAKEWRDVSVRRFEEIRRFNPKKTRESNPLQRLERVSDNHDIITIEASEIKEVTQESLLKEFVSLARKLNITEIAEDQEKIDSLKPASIQLIRLGELTRKEFHSSISTEVIESMCNHKSSRRLLNKHEPASKQQDRT